MLSVTSDEEKPGMWSLAPAQGDYPRLAKSNGLFLKKYKQVRGQGIECMEFTGVLKKEHVESPGFNKKEVEIRWGVYTKLTLNFHESWFSTLEFPPSVIRSRKSINYIN